MAKGFKHGGGGSGGGSASLNFEVVGNPQPASPKDNTIWVNTDAEITSWVFSATEPETPAEGMIWITTGVSSSVEFNALKKNGIYVYPLYAKQYVSGAWVDKTAMSYQNGAWVDWVTYLYATGNECTELTGGWQARSWAYSGSIGGALPTLELNADKMVATLPGGSAYRSGAVEVKKDIDLSKHSKLCIDWEGFSENAYNDEFVLSIVVGNRDVSLMRDAKVASADLMELGASASRQVSELPVSDISGYYSVFILMVAVQARTQITVYKIWLE